MYIVGFNGPPRSGKDTLAQMLEEHMRKQGVPSARIRQDSLSMPLRHIAYAMTGWGGEVDGPNYEKFKEQYFDEFLKGGRHVMIDVSERFLKPVYGEQIMAKMLLRRHIGFDAVVLVRDMGFQCEVNPLRQWTGGRNLYLVNVERPGCDFTNDSREWVNHNDTGCQMIVRNTGSLDDLRTEAGRIYGRLVNQMGWTL